MEKPKTSEAASILEKSGVGYLLPDVIDVGKSVLGNKWKIKVPGIDMPKVNVDFTAFANEDETTLGASADPALIAYGGRVLEQLRVATDHQRSLYELVDSTEIELDKLLPLVERLVGMHLLKYVSKDKKGNHQIALTDKALNLAL